MGGGESEAAMSSGHPRIASTCDADVAGTEGASGGTRTASRQGCLWCHSNAAPILRWTGGETNPDSRCSSKARR